MTTKNKMSLLTFAVAIAIAVPFAVKLVGFLGALSTLAN